MKRRAGHSPYVGGWVMVALTVVCCHRPTPEPEPRWTLAAVTGNRDWTRPEVLPGRPLVLGPSPHLGVRAAVTYQPLADYLARTIEHPVVIHVSRTYEELTDLLVGGELDMAMVTPLVYVKARARLPELRLLVSLVTEGVRRFRGYIVTRSGPRRAAKRLAQLRGKRFAFVNRTSASGYLFAQDTLYRAGILPERDFSKIVYTGSHLGVIEQVLAGQVDAGALSSTAFAQFRRRGAPFRLQVVAKTDWIPHGGFVLHSHIPESVAIALQHSLLSLNTRTAEGRAILNGISVTNGFVFGNDRLYDSVRQVVASLDAPGSPASQRRAVLSP